MKIAACIVVVAFCLGFTGIAQTIPNAGFETWLGGTPTGWYTLNIPPLYLPVTQTASAHSGSSAVLGTVISAAGTPYPPVIFAGANAQGFPVSSRPAALHGWYKFSSDSGDAFDASVTLIKNRAGIGVGVINSTTLHSVYTEFVANIDYLTADIPDTAQIFFLITNSAETHIGSSFTIDDLSFGPATGVTEDGRSLPHEFALSQNYPNPFNPSTMIQFQLPEKQFVSLKVYNVTGQEVATLVHDQMEAGKYRAEFNAGKLPSGVYFYHFQAGPYRAVKKMMLVK